MSDLTPNEIRRACEGAQAMLVFTAYWDVGADPGMVVLDPERPKTTGLVALAYRCQAVAAEKGWHWWPWFPKNALGAFVSKTHCPARTNDIEFDPTNERKTATAVLKAFLEVLDMEGE